jgi:hypothetical protein
MDVWPEKRVFNHSYCSTSRYSLTSFTLLHKIDTLSVYHFCTLLEKRSFVPVYNPHLYRLLNRYKFFGTNNVMHLYRVESRPGTNVFCPISLFPFPFLFLISFSSHLIQFRFKVTKFTSNLIPNLQQFSSQITRFTISLQSQSLCISQ